MSFVSSSNTDLTAINDVMVQLSNVINPAVHRYTQGVSAWMDLIKKDVFPDGQGYTQNTLIYERVLPSTATNGNTVGVNWHSIGITEASTTTNTALATGRNLLAGSTKQLAGPNSGDTDADNDFDSSDGNTGDVRSFINWSRKIKAYSLSRGIVESPRISLDDLRFAAYRNEQVRALIDLMAEASKFIWEDRYRDEYERVAANLVPCLSASTPIATTIDVSASTLFEGTRITSVDFNNDFVSSGVDVDYTPTANISNAILDKIYQRLVRAGAGMTAYGRENARPVFGLVCSPEASLFLQRESGIRDDIRYNNAKVSDLIAPLGVERSFRGFYHLIDDNAPRFTFSSGTATRVRPQTISGGVVSDNASYDTAGYEAAYVLHQDVMHSLIPNPMSGVAGMTFDPSSHRGEFKWTNNRHDILNPDGKIGFYRGLFDSATKPIKTNFGYVILFKRDTATLAA